MLPLSVQLPKEGEKLESQTIQIYGYDGNDCTLIIIIIIIMIIIPNNFQIVENIPTAAIVSMSSKSMADSN